MNDRFGFPEGPTSTESDSHHFTNGVSVNELCFESLVDQATAPNFGRDANSCHQLRQTVDQDALATIEDIKKSLTRSWIICSSLDLTTPQPQIITAVNLSGYQLEGIQFGVSFANLLGLTSL